MQKSTSSSSRTSRKRKQPANYSPLSRKEEKEVTLALNLSLRKIPANGDISEDDLESDDEAMVAKIVEEKNFEVQTDMKQNEIKWGNQIQEMQVENFNQPSGPTRTLPFRQGVKNFFELMFTKKVWMHICKQTNLYAEQRMQIQSGHYLGIFNSWRA